MFYMNSKGLEAIIIMNSKSFRISKYEEMFYMNNKGLETSIIWTEKVGDVLYEQQRFGD